MATTSIWGIKKRLDHVIDYTTNPSKTSKESYSELHNVVEYVKASYKTEEHLYVTTLNCSKENPYQDMMRTKKRFHKMDGILGFHAFQSFAEGEVTPEIAHEIGVKLAEEMWGDRFEVIVTTHLNTNHLHNHFCLNSVSFEDGKKYYNNRHTYALLRATSDSICREYNLSVIEEKTCGKHNIDYTKYYEEQIQKSNYYNEIKSDIDYAIEQAYSYIDFVDIMKKMDYVVENRAGKISIRRFDRKRNTRIERAFGEEYSWQRINERIFETENVRVPFPEVRTLSGKYKYSSRNKSKLKNKKKITGIRALYFHYCYLLKVYPKKKKRMSKELREEIKKMDKISEEVRFLSSKNIQTDQELFSFKSSSIEERRNLKCKRDSLYKKKRKVKSQEEIQKIDEELKNIKEQIAKINHQNQLISDIEQRITEIKEKLQEPKDNQIKKNEKEKEADK